MEIWERGYIDHGIRDASDYSRHVEYIQQNRVQARIAAVTDVYRYSSAHAGFDLDPCPQG